MAKHEDRHARNNRFGGYPEHMEDYRLANGYEWRDGLLQPKVDPRSLNDHGIPTNDFNLPAQPGLNMLPLNARTQTRNRYLDQSITKGMVKVRGVGEGEPLNYAIPYLKSEYVDTDIRQFLGYVFMGGSNGVTFDESFIEKYVADRKQIIFGKPSRIVKDGNIKIMQGGSYIVQYYCDFYYPQGHNTREIQKLWLSLWYNGQVDAMRTTQRACMSQDGIQGTYIGGLNEGDTLNVRIAHTFDDEEVLCFTSINIVKTG